MVSCFCISMSRGPFKDLRSTPWGHQKGRLGNLRLIIFLDVPYIDICILAWDSALQLIYENWGKLLENISCRFADPPFGFYRTPVPSMTTRSSLPSSSSLAGTSTYQEYKHMLLSLSLYCIYSILFLSLSLSLFTYIYIYIHIHHHHYYHYYFVIIILLCSPPSLLGPPPPF